MAMAVSLLTAATITLIVSMILTSCSCTEAYAFGHFAPPMASKVSKMARGGMDGSAVTPLYLFPSPSSETAANHFNSNQQRHRQRRLRPDRFKSGGLPAMSNSILATNDTLPSLHTAYGLLSPEVVTRIADANKELALDDPLYDFLKSYRSKGPMGCVWMLSDPDILGELTKAMREIAA